MNEKDYQVIEERWNDKNICVHPEALKEINRLLAEVRRLNQSNKARECCGNCKNHKYSQRFGMSCPVHGDRIHPSNWCELWISGKESEVADNG